MNAKGKRRMTGRWEDLREGVSADDTIKCEAWKKEKLFVGVDWRLPEAGERQTTVLFKFA